MNDLKSKIAQRFWRMLMAHWRNSQSNNHLSAHQSATEQLVTQFSGQHALFRPVYSYPLSDHCDDGQFFNLELR